MLFSTVNDRGSSLLPLLVIFLSVPPSRSLPNCQGVITGLAFAESGDDNPKFAIRRGPKNDLGVGTSAAIVVFLQMLTARILQPQERIKIPALEFEDVFRCSPEPNCFNAVVAFGGGSLSTGSLAVSLPLERRVSIALKVWPL